MEFFSVIEKYKQNQKKNKRNDRSHCKDSDEVPTVRQTRTPSTELMQNVLSSKEGVKPPFYFQADLDLKDSSNIKVQENKVKQWVVRATNGKACAFQYDCTAAHET